jgi:excisionase family DNA binding protein
MARRFNRRRIKIHHSYTIDEAARALGAHKNTVRNWVRKEEVPLVCDRRPYLIQGRALREFLATEQAKNKSRCGPGQIYCLSCRSPKNPDGAIADYRPLTRATGNLRGLCPDCGRLVHRVVSLARIEAVCGNLEVTFPQEVEPIRQAAVPSGNCDLEKKG